MERKLEGQERLFLTHATFLPDGSALRLRAEDPKDFSIEILPHPRNFWLAVLL